ncbi:MAG: deoxyribose-phosphate aldolase [Actinomycetota bacterium]|nr:deoxyribose-phosphate aldolase [Actinomycetota bacterium]
MTAIDTGRIVGLIDLTSLDPDDTEKTVDALCDKAVTVKGPVAAVCIMPAFVALAAERLEGTGVRVATVANFPAGHPDPHAAAREVALAVAAGADEVDVVAPWRAALEGDYGAVSELVTACAAECEQLKVILETGSHPDPAKTRILAEHALEAGARFLKTSTGKHGPGASLDATRILLRVAGRRAGVKAAGGIRTRAEAADYVALADQCQGVRATAQSFRIGASLLLDDLLKVT